MTKRLRHKIDNDLVTIKKSQIEGLCVFWQRRYCKMCKKMQIIMVRK